MRCACGPRGICRGRRRSRSTGATRPSTQRDRALGQDERAADRIAHHRARRCCGTPGGAGAAAARPPLNAAVDQPPETRATKMNSSRSRRNAQHHAPGFCAAAADRRRVRRLQAVERALGGLPFGAVGRELGSPAARPSAAPSRSCLPNALTMPTFSSVLRASDRASASGRTARAPCPAGSCSSSRRRDRC